MKKYKEIASSIFGWDGFEPLTADNGTEHMYRTYLLEDEDGKKYWKGYDEEIYPA